MIPEEPMSAVIRDLSTTLPVPDSGIASSPLLDLQGSTKLVLFAIDSGQEISPHATPFPAQVLLLAGKIDVLVGNRWTTLIPGERHELPAGEPHGIRAQEASHFLLTMLRGVK
jgi:quercetin dioxygenase-like cupin family protein